MDNKQKLEHMKLLAARMHGLQEYDKFPYVKHLKDVANVLMEFGYNEYSDECIAAWGHDMVEDCPISYQYLKKEFGEIIANIIYDVTDELGKTRIEKKVKTYPKTRGNQQAVVLKLADRIANVTNSMVKNPTKFKMYLKEHSEFKEALYIPNEMDKIGKLDRMWDRLENLLGIKEL